jgi:peptidoglycan-N-acetylglucosamine deacetylase
VKAALSLDIDNQWAYMKTHGDAGWETFPSYLDLVIPRALEMLSAHNLRVTFFIVGQDADIDGNARSLRTIARCGHEIGNHSFHHEPWLHRRSESEIDEELERAEASIESVTGVRPRGFRGPGFVRSAKLLSVLKRRGYAYDASTLPTFIGPFARAYYFKTAKLDRKSKMERVDLFGSLSDAFEPNKRHFVNTYDGPIQEIPVTTMPGLRIPIHISYVLYLATISEHLATLYFRTAIHLCRITRTEPSILLHPLDFIDERECPELRFFPAMGIPVAKKLQIVHDALSTLTAAYDVVPLLEFSGLSTSELVEA